MIYFAWGGNGLVKIGCSSHVEGRVRGLRLELLVCIPGMEKTERFIHKKFAHLRVHGEWFCPETELLDFIAKPKVPKFDERERRTKETFLALRMSKEERIRWQRRAAADGLSLSAWIRMTLIGAINAKGQKTTTASKAGNQSADTAKR